MRQETSLWPSTQSTQPLPAVGVPLKSTPRIRASPCTHWGSCWWPYRRCSLCASGPAASWMQFLRQRRRSPLLFRRSLLCLSRSLSSRHCASRLQGTTSSMHPSIRRPPGGLQRAKDTASITATRICLISMHSRTSTGSIRRRSAAKSLRPLPTPASRLPVSAPKRFTGQASGCSASRTITPTTRGLRALPPPSGSGRRCPRM